MRVARGRLFYLAAFISHKLLRWLTLPLLLLLVGAALYLLREGVVYLVVLTVVTVGALFALAGGYGRGGRPGRLANLFFLLHAAALSGFVQFVRGNRYTTWNPRAN